MLTINFLHTTGTQTGDVQELNCIDDIFNDEVHYSKRKSPLYVGSVKSNIGHAESSSGICSIIKCLFAFMFDAIPPVINYHTPNPKVPALLNGRIKIVVDTLPLNTDLISVSSFGFGGSNMHVILQNGKSIRSVKDNFVSANKLNCLDGYQLVNLAARSEQALMDSLNKLAQQFRAYDLNRNELYLLNDTVYREQIRLGFQHTGHLILNLRNPNEEPKIHINAEPLHSRNVIDYHRQNANTSTNNNKLFYAVPGLGCQWTGMAVGLLEVPFFARRLKQLCDMIQPSLEFDIYKFMLADQEDTAFEVFSDSIFCLVAVAIYQMSFLDLLKEIGLKPDGFFGHSFGELLCGYLDGLITDQQVLDATLVVCKLKHLYDECDMNDRPINNFLFERGQMAVVGLNWEDTLREIKESKVQKVNAACNNSADCVTVSGADDQVEEFLEHLTKKSIFNRKVASCGMAFHCEMVKDFYDFLLKGFREIFKNQVKRSNKWISTSIDPLSESESISWLAADSGKMNRKEKQTFADYFANCILKPVLFRQACEKMTSDLSKQAETVGQVFVLEISPRSFLTSLMKSNTSKLPSVSYLPAFSLVKPESLFKKPNPNVLVLLNVVGILNENGLYSSLAKLYGGSSGGQVNGLTNGGYTNGHLKNGSSPKSPASSPIVTNRLFISSIIGWDHSADFPVPAYPEFFNASSDENKVDLNSVNYKVYLPNKTTKYRLPISFYVELVLNQFQKLNDSVQFRTAHIQDLVIYRLEELSEEDLADVSIELLEFYEHNAFGQIFLFIVKNRNDQLILSGNLAVSNLKLNRLDQHNDSSLDDSTSRLPADQFYEGLNCSDSKQQHLVKDLLISNDRIQGELKCDSNWSSQLDSLLQLYAHYHKQLIKAEIGEQTLQIHAITIELQADEEEAKEVWFDNQMNIAQSRQVEIKSVRLNGLPGNDPESRLTVDQNANVEFASKQAVINELGKQKLTAKWFKANRKNLSFIAENEKSAMIGFLSEADKFSSKNCWPSQHPADQLAQLVLLDGYLIASELLSRKCKLTPNLQSAFLNCEQHLDLLIAFGDLLTARHCETYVLLNDQSKAELVRGCFAGRSNLHILNIADPQTDDFDLDLLRQTDGEGCQLVISQANSRSEFNKSISCLSLGGMYVHLNNKQTSVNNVPLGMSLFLKNVDFQGLTVDDLDLAGVADQNAQSTLDSIDAGIVQQLNKLNRFEMERMFEVNFIQN